MRIGLKLDGLVDAMSLEQRIIDSRTAAAAGFASIWSSEPTNGDALTALAVVGREVPGIALGTAILHTYPRHPLVLANQALTVQAATGNRLILGVGPGAQLLVEAHYGTTYVNLARDVREYLAVLEPLLRSEEVDFQGDTLSGAGSVAVPGAEPPMLLLAALEPVMLRLAGQLADGTVTAFTGPVALAHHVVPTITRAAAEAGRLAPRIVAGVVASVTHRADRVRAAMGEELGFFGAIPSYRAMLDREGVSGVQDVAMIGDETTIERQVRRYAEAGATDLVVSPYGSDEERARVIAVLGELARTGSPRRMAAD